MTEERKGIRPADVVAMVGVGYNQVKSWLDLVCEEGRDYWPEKGQQGRGRPRHFYRPDVVDVLVQLATGEVDVQGARAILAGKAPPAPKIEEPLPLPEIDDEELIVMSAPKRWPDGSVRHFLNPYVIQCQRQRTKELVFVTVPSSRNFVPMTASGKPMTLRAKFTGIPRNWEMIGLNGPRWPGVW